MRIESSLLVDLSLERPSVIDQLRSQLTEVRAVEGRIIGQSSPGRYQVIVGGQRLTFMPSRPLEVGAQFTARLVGGRLVLDFPPGAVPTPEVAAAGERVTVSTLPEVLAELGLPADPQYVATVRGLLRAGVSLTPEAVQLFQQHTGAGGLESPLLLAFLIQRAIPVDASLLGVLEALFRERKALGESLPRLLVEGEALALRLAGQEGAGVLAGLLERLRRQFVRVELEGPTEGGMEELRRCVAGSGVFRESRWALALAEGGEHPPLGDLKSLLLELEDWAKRLMAEAPEHSAQTSRLGSAARAAVSSIEAAQLASARAPWESRQLWFLEVPIRVENQLESFQMVIEGECPKRGQPMPPPIQVDLYLELTQLGRLRVALTLLQDGVDGQVISDRPEVVRILGESLPTWLENRSREAEGSFPFRRLGARQAKKAEELSPPALLQPRGEGGPGAGLGRVDLKA